jgi:hypothetical protein
MSSDPSTSEEEFSEFVRGPTRTAGELSEVADRPAGITTEDVAHDLESVASKSRTPAEKELLEELLRRVERIEEHLGIASTGPHDEYLDPSRRSISTFCVELVADLPVCSSVWPTKAALMPPTADAEPTESAWGPGSGWLSRPAQLKVNLLATSATRKDEHA